MQVEICLEDAPQPKRSGARPGGCAPGAVTAKAAAAAGIADAVAPLTAEAIEVQTLSFPFPCAQPSYNFFNFSLGTAFACRVCTEGRKDSRVA